MNLQNKHKKQTFSELEWKLECKNTNICKTTRFFFLVHFCTHHLNLKHVTSACLAGNNFHYNPIFCSYALLCLYFQQNHLTFGSKTAEWRKSEICVYLRERCTECESKAWHWILKLFFLKRMRVFISWNLSCSTSVVLDKVQRFNVNNPPAVSFTL